MRSVTSRGLAGGVVYQWFVDSWLGSSPVEQGVQNILILGLVESTAGCCFVSRCVWLKPSRARHAVQGGRPGGSNPVLLTKQGTVKVNLTYSRRAA